ncbi:MAG TPA: glycine cleavage system protein H [Gemmataceae bacterium]|jgi:glycine cleavage system H protein|nr:glycine cleavage system protein H [Gemmataceae bacterium]
MAEPLTFMMGKFAATLPADLLYCKNHMWCRPSDGRHRFGFTAYALRLMQDVYFLDWSVNVGDTLALKQQIGNIETSKAVSDLFAPIGGTLAAINGDVLKDPSTINVDGYGRGWLFEIAGDAVGTMDAAGYHAFLAATWDQTQRILKGQMGE